MYIATNYAWSTHQPLLQGLMEVLCPKYIVELGVGIYSTPIFLKYNFDKYIGIENDSNWLDHILNTVDHDSSRCRFTHHFLNDAVIFNTRPNTVTDALKEDIRGYYNELLKEVKEDKSSPKMLFVDNFTCCRTIAINTLYNAFDIVAYHDDEPAGTPWYEYYFDKSIYANCNKFTLVTPSSWTSCFIKKNINFSFDELNKITISKVEEYCRINNLNRVDFRLDRIGG
jgi:hypothetical protein